jgi:hypothetical protein
MPQKTDNNFSMPHTWDKSLSRPALVILSLIVFLWIFRSLPWEVIPAYSQDRQAFYLLDIRDNQSWILPSNPEPRVPATKPPLLAWISTMISYVLGVNAFSLRLPSLLASVGSLLLIYWFTKNYFGERAALFSVMAFGLNPLYIRISTLVRTDALLTFMVTVYSLLILIAVHKGKKLSWKENVVIWSVISLLFLLKGPAFLPFFVAMFVFPFFFRINVADRIDFRWFWTPLLIYGGWVYAAWMAGGTDFFNIAIQNDIIDRIMTENERRKQSFYFYLMHMITTLMPWFLIFLVFMFSGKRWKKMSGNPMLVGLLCWSLGSLLIMSLIPSKRMDRMIAAWPAFAILIGVFFSGDTESAGNRLSRFLFLFFGWTGAVGSVIVFSSILLKGGIRIPFFNLREAMDIIPSVLYISAGSTLLAGIIFMAAALNRRLSSDTPVFCGLALFLIFSLYSIQQATTPKYLIDVLYHGFSRDVQDYLGEKNFEGRIVLGIGERQMFWYTKVSSPKLEKELLNREEKVAYIAYSSEARLLEEKGFAPVLTSKSIPDFIDYNIFALFLPASTPGLITSMEGAN